MAGQPCLQTHEETAGFGTIDGLARFNLSSCCFRWDILVIALRRSSAFYCIAANLDILYLSVVASHSDG